MFPKTKYLSGLLAKTKLSELRLSQKPFRSLFLALVLAFVGTNSYVVEGAIPLGHGRLVLDATAKAEYDSNIFVNSDEIEDFVYEFVPTVRFEQDDAIFHITASMGVAIGRFDDFEDENFEDFQSNIGLSFPHRQGAPGSFQIRGGYNEQSEPNVDVGVRTRSNELSFEAVLDYAFSDKTAIRLNLGYQDVDYETVGFSDHDTPQLGLRAFWAYSPNLDVLVGYRYQDTDSQAVSPGALFGLTKASSISSQDHAGFVGFEGEMPGFSKVFGNIEIGLQNRSFTDNPLADDTSFFLQAGLGWDATDKTQLSLVGSSDFFTTPNNLSNDSTRIVFDVAHAFTGRLNGRVGVELEYSNYSGLIAVRNREDNAFSVRGGFSYFFRSNLSASADFSYTDRKSTLEMTEYKRFLGSVVLRFSY